MRLYVQPLDEFLVVHFFFVAHNFDMVKIMAQAGLVQFTLLVEQVTFGSYYQAVLLL
jgi:hypothetical protein